MVENSLSLPHTPTSVGICMPYENIHENTIMIAMLCFRYTREYQLWCAIIMYLEKKNIYKMCTDV